MFEKETLKKKLFDFEVLMYFSHHCTFISGNTILGKSFTQFEKTKK